MGGTLAFPAGSVARLPCVIAIATKSIASAIGFDYRRGSKEPPTVVGGALAFPAGKRSTASVRNSDCYEVNRVSNRFRLPPRVKRTTHCRGWCVGVPGGNRTHSLSLRRGGSLVQTSYFYLFYNKTFIFCNMLLLKMLNIICILRS